MSYGFTIFPEAVLSDSHAFKGAQRGSEDAMKNRVSGRETNVSDEVAQAAAPQQWRVEQVKDGRVAFDCPKCQLRHEFDAGAFAHNPTRQIEGLTKTDQAVSRTFGQKFLAVIVGLVVYYFAHRWINGPDVSLNHGILLPVFIAVAAYTISMPLFSAGLFSGKGIPVYCYKCPQCQSDVLIASDGKSLALPVAPTDSKDNPEAK